jgi:aminoglycoside phosphotransferase (APT) family kinase protein
VSSQVTAIDAELPGGAAQRLLVRQYGPANLLSDPHSAAHEHLLLSLLHDDGLAVPCPRRADESRKILPVPYLVTEFIEGEVCTEPSQLTVPVTDFARELAAFLARLHGAGVTRAAVLHLADKGTVATQQLETRPAGWMPPSAKQPSAPYWPASGRRRSSTGRSCCTGIWPGNVLWRHGAITGVIDWEDAAFGDPLADLCLTRMELCMAFGTPAMRELTWAYRDLMPGLDMAALPHWDLFAALRHAGRMSAWGLAAADLARLRAGHRAFVAMALAQVADEPGRTGPLP